MALYPSFSKLNVLLGKVQASLGTKQASLINTDLRTVGEDFSLDYVRDFKEQGLAQGIFGQPQKIKGMASVDAKVTLPIIPTGSTTVPDVHDFLTCCGMAYALVGNEHTYSPSSDVETDWKDMTLWGYTGDKAAARSLLTKAHSFMFDLKLSWTIGEAMMAEFTGKGVPDGIPAPGTYPASLGLISTVPPAFLKSTSLNILGGTYCVLKGEITMGNQIELVKCPSADDGFLRTTIKSRISAFALTCYQDMGNEDPLAEMDAETIDALLLTFGVAGSRISVESNSAQITACKNGKDGDLNTHEISGYFLNNNWWMPINKA
jgi:hypothetical protein